MAMGDVLNKLQGVSRQWYTIKEIAELCKLTRVSVTRQLKNEWDFWGTVECKKELRQGKVTSYWRVRFPTSTNKGKSDTKTKPLNKSIGKDLHR